MTMIIGVGFVAKEPIPYSGTGWKRVVEQESCLAGVFCLQDRRDKKETIFLRGGVGGVFPMCKMERVGGDWLNMEHLCFGIFYFFPRKVICTLLV